MHASSPGDRFCGPARPESDAVCAHAGFSMPPPPREKLPAHVVHDDGTRAALDALVEAHYPCAVTVCDALEADEPIIFANRLFESCTGYDAIEVLGKNWRFLQYRGAYATETHPLVDTSVTAAMRNAIKLGVPFRGTLVCFRRDGTPLVSELDVVPVRGDPWRPEAVTLLLYVHHFRPSDLALGPLPPKLPGWLPDTLGGERAPIPTPVSWALGGGNERDARDWVSVLGDRELSHLLGFLNIKGLAAIACTCRRMRRLVKADGVWLAACSRLWSEPTLALLRNPVAQLGWRRVAREVYTLEALQWRRLRVGGAVSPVRTNFSTCGVGNRVYIFGGEGADASAYNDLFVLDLDVPAPAWQALALPTEALLPPGRWGHTLRELGSSALVLFGGCSAAGPLNDVFVLNLAVSPPVWREVVCAPEPAPVPRSWHGACTLNGRELLIFGGCSSTGKLLSDTWRLNLELEFPRWEELSHGWTPPARLGLSLVATEEGRVFAFGGLASAGPVRLRSQDAFSMDLRSPEPTWHYVTGSQLPSGAAAAGTPPPPRLEQVAGTLIGGRVLVFGGSVNGGSINAAAAAWEPYVLSPNVETPTWRRLPVRGQGPRDAWGYSACMLGAHRFILPGKLQNGMMDVNEMHELSLFSDFDVDAGPDTSCRSDTARRAGIPFRKCFTEIEAARIARPGCAGDAAAVAARAVAGRAPNGSGETSNVSARSDGEAACAHAARAGCGDGSDQASPARAAARPQSPANCDPEVSSARGGNMAPMWGTTVPMHIGSAAAAAARWLPAGPAASGCAAASAAASAARVAAAAAATGGHVASSLRGDEAAGDYGAASSSHPPVPPGFVVVMARRNSRSHPRSCAEGTAGDDEPPAKSGRDTART